MNPIEPSGPDGRQSRLDGYYERSHEEPAKQTDPSNEQTESPSAFGEYDFPTPESPLPELWVATRAAEPSESAWESVRLRIQERLVQSRTSPRVNRGNLRQLLAVAACVACSLLIVGLATNWVPEKPQKEGSPQSAVIAVAPMPREVNTHDPLAEITEVELAGPGDAIVEAVFGDAPKMGFFSDNPVSERLSWASNDDVQLIEMSADTRNDLALRQLSVRPGGMPMIYAAVVKR